MVKIEAVGERVSVLGEGPHWDNCTSTLIYVDVLKREIVRFDPQTKTESVVSSQDDRIGTAIPYAEDSSQMVMCIENRIYKLDTGTQDKTLLVELNESAPSRFNDGKCDAAGRLWSGTMPKAVNFKKPPQGEHNLYSFSSGSLGLRAPQVSFSNGMAWTSDNRTMFHNQSIPGTTYAYDFDQNTGDLSNRRILVEFRTTPEYKDLGVPDGMTVDAYNKIWMVCFGAGSVIQVDPETARILTRVQLPTKYPQSCCFGGKNFDVLYVTSVSHFAKTPVPADGLLYQLTELGAKGKAPSEFAG